MSTFRFINPDFAQVKLYSKSIDVSRPIPAGENKWTIDMSWPIPMRHGIIRDVGVTPMWDGYTNAIRRRKMRREVR